MMRTELAAVISGGNAQGAPLWAQRENCTHTGSHGFCNCSRGETVDNDFQNTRDVAVECAAARALQRRTEHVIGRSDDPFVFGADLGTRAYDAPRERQDDVRYGGDGFHGALCCRQCRLTTRTHDNDIAAANCILGEAGRRVANEFTVHHRYAPIASVSETLGDLPAVAEETQRVTKL